LGDCLRYSGGTEWGDVSNTWGVTNPSLLVHIPRSERLRGDDVRRTPERARVSLLPVCRRCMHRAEGWMWSNYLHTIPDWVLGAATRRHAQHPYRRMGGAGRGGRGGSTEALPACGQGPHARDRHVAYRPACEGLCGGNTGPHTGIPQWRLMGHEWEGP